MEDRPWNEVNRGKPITQNWLARHLRRFGIHPTTLRIGEGRAKGYQQTDFADAFDRYLSDQAGQVKRNTVTCEGKGGFETVTSDADVTDGKTPATEGMSRCHAQDAPPNDLQPSADSNLKPIEEEALLL